MRMCAYKRHKAISLILTSQNFHVPSALTISVTQGTLAVRSSNSKATRKFQNVYRPCFKAR